MGRYLVSQKQLDAAINHFIEAGATIKAVDTAINSRQWSKAVHILEVVQDQNTTSKYYKKIAEHYARVGEYELAEKFFVESENTKDAIDMYNSVGKWEQAHRVGREYNYYLHLC